MLEQQRSRLNSIYIFKVLWLNLRLKRKIQLALLPVLMLLSSFAELLTLAGIIPFLSIINNPDALQSNKFAAIIAELFDITGLQCCLCCKLVWNFSGKRGIT